MATVTLNPWEFKACVDVANQRMAISNEKNLNHASTYQRTHLERMEQEITGACGEMAVCKALGKFWTPSVNTFHTVADITPEIEVRATRHMNGCLIVRDNDPSDRYYFLVVGEPPTVEVVGYMLGEKAKHPTFMRDPHNQRPAYFVPQKMLTRIQGDR